MTMTGLITRCKRWALRGAFALALIFLIPALDYVRDVHAAIAYGYRTAIWLSTPVAKLPNGTTLVRAQLIDLALQREAAALQAEWLLKAKPAN
jgi:hypothetical protein